MMPEIFSLATQEEYDVIESDTIHPEQNANVFSREYFELARERLSEDGVFSVWLPMYGMSEETFKILINTLYSAFPHVTVWYASTQPTRHALLIGSKQKLKIDYGLLQEELAYPPVRESLAEVGLEDVFTVLGSFITDESRLRRIRCRFPGEYGQPALSGLLQPGPEGAILP